MREHDNNCVGQNKNKQRDFLPLLVSLVLAISRYITVVYACWSADGKFGRSQQKLRISDVDNMADVITAVSE